jgi:hypothetical protein
MKPSDKSVTLEESRNMSTEEWEALPFSVQAELMAQDLVENLNRNVAALGPAPTAAENEAARRKAA